MPAHTPIRPSRAVAVAATVFCLLAVVAAVVAFWNGSWFGVAWVLLAGITSNMAWYYWRRLRTASARPTTDSGE